MIATRSVAGAGGVELGFQIKNHRLGRKALIEGGGVDEGLEGRTRLAVGEGDVEVAFIFHIKIVARTDHREELAGFRVNRHQPGIPGAKLLFVPVAVLADQGLGFLLEFPIQGGYHFVAASPDFVGAVFLFQIITNKHYKVRRFDGTVADTGKLNRFCLSRRRLCRRQKADLAHPTDDQIFPIIQLLAMLTERGVVSRRFGDGGDVGSLGDADLARRLAEEGASRFLHAVDAAAVRRLVQIERQNLVLGHHLFQLESQNQFFEFASEGSVLGQNGVFNRLLGNR